MKKIAFLYCLIIFCSQLFGQITFEVRWTKYYESVEGKIMGIWPHNSRYSELSRMKELRYRWGFNHILLARGRGLLDYSMIRTAGFDSLNIMRQIRPDSYVENVESIPETWSYYIDEPADLNENIIVWTNITNWVKSKYPNTKIVLSGYKRNDFLKEYVETISDNVMFSSYKHWWELFGIWISWPENPDQRADWKDMQNLFSNKFKFSWVGAHRDLGEYDDLLGKAKNLFLSGVFLYQLEPETEVDDNNLESFSEAATKHGFMERYYQQVRKKYQDGNLVSTQFVGPSYLGEAPDQFDHTNLVFTNYVVTNKRSENYFAENRIIAGNPNTFIIPPAKKSTLNSNNEIILKPGFHAELGSEFRAYIGKE